VIDFESSDLDATLLVHHPVLIELPMLERHTRKGISMRCQTCAWSSSTTRVPQRSLVLIRSTIFRSFAGLVKPDGPHSVARLIQRQIV
jgi:hypothetical protein